MQGNNQMLIPGQLLPLSPTWIYETQKPGPGPHMKYSWLDAGMPSLFTAREVQP